MDSLIVFGDSNVRVFHKDGSKWDGQDEAWFLPAEVATAIGYSEPRIAASKIINRNPAKFAGFSSVTNMVTEAGMRETTIINENGLYMFLMASDMPKAIEFQRKASEFLKQFRRTGSYFIIPKTLPEALRAYANEVERRQALEAENLKMLPKAEFHDRVVATEGEMTMEAAAKELRTGRNRLFRELRNKRILKSNNLPMQEYLDRGYFRVVQNPLYFGENGVPYAQTMVTGKGLVWLSKQIADAGGLKRDA